MFVLHFIILCRVFLRNTLTSSSSWYLITQGIHCVSFSGLVKKKKGYWLLKTRRIFLPLSPDIRWDRCSPSIGGHSSYGFVYSSIGGHCSYGFVYSTIGGHKWFIMSLPAKGGHCNFIFVYTSIGGHCNIRLAYAAIGWHCRFRMAYSAIGGHCSLDWPIQP